MDLSKLKPKDLPERRPGMCETDWVLEMLLARKGSKAHKAGMHILTTGGSAAIPVLISYALARDIKPAHCVRLLDLILQIGEPLSAKHCSSLATLLIHGSSKACEKMVEVIVTLGAEGPAMDLARQLQVRLSEPSVRGHEEDEPAKNQATASIVERRQQLDGGDEGRSNRAGSDRPNLARRSLA